MILDSRVHPVGVGVGLLAAGLWLGTVGCQPTTDPEQTATTTSTTGSTSMTGGVSMTSGMSTTAGDTTIDPEPCFGTTGQECDTSGGPPDACVGGDAKPAIEDAILETIAEHTWVAGMADDPLLVPYAVSVYGTDLQHTGADALPGPCMDSSQGMGSCQQDAGSGLWYCQRVGCQGAGIRRAEAWITTVDEPNPDAAPGLVMFEIDTPPGWLDTDAPYRLWLIEQAGAGFVVSSSFEMNAYVETGGPFDFTIMGQTSGTLGDPVSIELEWPLITNTGDPLVATITVPPNGAPVGELVIDGELVGTFDGQVTWLCP